MTWLKPETIIAAVIGLATVGGTLALNWSNGNVRSAISDQDVATLKADMREIKLSVAPLPVQASRLDRLEKWQSDVQGMFGAIDSRLRAAENTGERNTADIGNLRGASGAKLR